MDVSALRREFPALAGCTYLNTGTAGPVPVSVIDRMHELFRRSQLEGPARPAVGARLQAAVDATRGGVAALLGVEADSVALMPSTTDGINAAVLGLDWHPGDEAIVTALEHPAVRLPFAYLAHRYGVRVRVAPASGPTVTAGAIAGCLSARTRMVCVSHVFFTTGARLDVGAVAREARAAGALLVVDGAQSAGVFPVDVTALGADVYAFTGCKWLLGPEGSGAVYFGQRAHGVGPHRIGGAALAEADLDGNYRLHAGARRFEGSTYSRTTYAGLGMSLDYLRALGEAVSARVARLTARFKEGLRQVPGATLVTPLPFAASSGLVAFGLPGHDYPALVRRLAAEHNIVVRSIRRPAGLRASFHFYNTEDEVDYLLEVLRRL